LSLFDLNFFSYVKIDCKSKEETKDYESAIVTNVNKRDVSEDKSIENKSKISENYDFVSLNRSLLCYNFIN